MEAKPQRRLSFLSTEPSTRGDRNAEYPLAIPLRTRVRRLSVCVDRRGGERDGAQRHVRVCASERRPVGGSSERLSRLPRDVATRELCAIIAELPPGANRASPRSIAEHLMAPLPFSAGSGGSSGTAPGRAALTRRQTVRTAVVLLFLLVWMVFAAIAQQLASVEHAPAPTSDAIGSVK